MQHILVTGTIRSGTTWLGRVLATARGTAYLHEPFNPQSHWNAAMPFPHLFHCLTVRTGRLYAPKAAAILRLDPRIPMPWAQVAAERCEADIDRALAAPRNADLGRGELRVVFKDPIALYSAEWLFEAFGLAPLITLRHPVRVAKSMLRLGWADEGQLGPLRNQPALVARFYDGDDRALALDAERMASMDAADRICVWIKHWLHALAVYRRDHPEWGWLDYSRLVREPMPLLTEIFERLGLTPSEETWERFGRGEPGVYEEGLQTQRTLMPVPESDDLLDPSPGVGDWQRRFDEHFAEVAQRLRAVVSW